MTGLVLRIVRKPILFLRQPLKFPMRQISEVSQRIFGNHFGRSLVSRFYRGFKFRVKTWRIMRFKMVKCRLSKGDYYCKGSSFKGKKTAAKIGSLVFTCQNPKRDSGRFLSQMTQPRNKESLKNAKPKKIYYWAALTRINGLEFS